MNIWKLMPVIALISVSFTVVARQSPLENLAYRSFDSQNGRDVMPANLKVAVAEALMGYNGSITEERPGSMVLSLAPRSHVANVRMDYDAKGFSITYVSSSNLNYEKNRKGKEFIHPNYNAWIRRVADAVVASPQLWLTPEQLADYELKTIKTPSGVSPKSREVQHSRCFVEVNTTFPKESRQYPAPAHGEPTAILALTRPPAYVGHPDYRFDAWDNSDCIDMSTGGNLACSEVQRLRTCFSKKKRRLHESSGLWLRVRPCT